MLSRFARCALPAALLASAALFAGQAAPPPGGALRPVSAIGDLVLHGQTEPAARVEVPAAIRGILAELNVKEGQAIKKGDPLARLDDALQKQKVEFERLSAEGTAEIKYAQNQAEFAQRELEQMQKLAGGSQAELRQKQLAASQAVLALEAARDKQAQSQVRFREEQITLEHMTLRSPIDGSVLRVNKQVGEQTDENPVIVVVQTSRLNAVFYPPKELFGKIAVGDRINLDLEGAKREAVVAAVDPIIDPASQIFRVKLEVDNADGKLAAGVGAAWAFARK